MDKNFFDPTFQNFLQVIVPYGTKISIFEKSVSDNFFHSQNMFHNISRSIEAKKWTKIFSNQFFQIFYKLLSPMGPKFQFLKKVFPTIFFTHKKCFTTFHVD